MKTRRKNTRVAPPTKQRRHATAREAFGFAAPIEADNPDWLVGAD